MFDAVLERNSTKRRFGRSTLVAIAFHGGILAVAIVISSRGNARIRKAEDQLFVALFDSPAPAGAGADSEGGSAGGSAPPAGGALAKTATPADAHKAVTPTKIKPNEAPALHPTEAPPPQPAALTLTTTPTPAAPTGGDPPSTANPIAAAGTGTPGGTGNGSGTGTGNGTGSGNGNGSGTGTGNGTGSGNGTVGGSSVLPFGEGMNRPTLVTKVDPTYTREALLDKVAGLALVRCVITTDGHLRDCKIAKGLPHMDQAILTALSRWVYTPVTFQGRVVSVQYVIPVRLVLP